MENETDRSEVKRESYCIYLHRIESLQRKLLVETDASCVSVVLVYVARFYAESVWPSRGKVHGEWKGPTAGGCLNHDSVKNNVQYGLTILEPGPAEISISLLLEDVRGVEGKIVGDFPLVILEVYDHQGKPVNQSENTHTHTHFDARQPSETLALRMC